MTRRRMRLLAALVTVCGIRGAAARPLGAQQLPDTAFRSYTVVFWVSDVRKSVDFYHRLLGFLLVDYTVGRARSVQTLSASDSEPYAATLSIGEQKLALQRDVQPPKPSGVRFMVRVSDPAAYSTVLRQRGVPLHVIAGASVDDTTRAIWFSVTDPDGHQIEFVPLRAKR